MMSNSTKENQAATSNFRHPVNDTLTGIWNKLWNNRGPLSLLAGLLLGFSFPPFSLSFLTIPAFILFFRLCSLCSSPRQIAYYSYPAFLLWNILTTYWLTMATVAGGVAAILANAVLMTIPLVLMHAVQKTKFSPWLIALGQGAIWVTYEFLHHHWDLSWTWLALGNAWADQPAVIQYISVTGYLGISFWVVFTAAILYQAIRRRSGQIAKIAAVLALIPPVISLFQYRSGYYPATETVETAVVQPNFDSYADNGGFDTPMQASEMILALSDSVRSPSTGLVVWPENAVQAPLMSVSSPNSASDRLKSQLSDSVHSWNSTLLAGTTYFEYFQEDSIPPLSRQGRDHPYLYYNAALAIYPNSDPDVYRKHNLVPIVERIPFVHFLNEIDMAGFVDWPQIQGYGKGYEPTTFQAGPTSTPALICYDSVFPSWVRKTVRNGAGFLTIITNDGWWGNTSGHHQHFAYARLRAIEFRRWIVRSANNGISGIIGPGGEVKVKTDYWTRTAFTYDVPVINSQTIYTRWGDWFPLSMTGISLVFIVVLVRKR